MWGLKDLTVMLASGDEIGGRYRLLHRVGEGGMAVVWCAEHMSLQRLVAVKFIAHTGRKAEEQARRFLREARTMAVVRHRNVSEILDYGVTPDGTSYMVMEYLEGQDLADALNQEPALSLGTFLDVMAASLSGLAAVHDVGVIHRDIKPSNIFLVRDADGVFPKILDFGLSRKSPSAALKDSVGPLTDDGVIVGTLQYMAPEQVQGRDADVRGDLYAMGLITYEGVSGLRPFSSTNLVEAVAAISSGQYVPLDQAREGPFEELARVVHQSMARRPEDRFADARMFRERLNKAAQGFPQEILDQPLTIPAARDRDPYSLGIGKHIASLDTDIPRIPPVEKREAPPSPWPWLIVLASAVALIAVGSVVFHSNASPGASVDDSSRQSAVASADGPGRQPVASTSSDAGGLDRAAPSATSSEPGLVHTDASASDGSASAHRAATETDGGAVEAGTNPSKAGRRQPTRQGRHRSNRQTGRLSVRASTPPTETTPSVQTPVKGSGQASGQTSGGDTGGAAPARDPEAGLIRDLGF
jgi:serine/threonine-protein kinase